MSNFEIPKPDKVQSIIGGLVLGGVTVESSADPSPAGKTATAVYQTENQEATAVCICDVELANYLGASLSMIPPGQANDNITAGDLPDNIRDNLVEVLNVAANIFKGIDSPRLTLKELFGPSDDLPEEISKIVESPSAGTDLKVNVNQYGTGKMSLVVA